MRGSLDILLATPISTRDIVLAKWWSVFRETPRLMVLPALVASVLAHVSDNDSAVVPLLLNVVSAAALWTSIGLAISTWVPKLGRAIALAVVLYALVNLGWPIFVLNTFQNSVPLSSRLASVSTFHTAFDLTLGIKYGIRVEYSRWIIGLTIAQTVMAFGLLLATLATFDRCLGRVRG